MRDSSTLLYTTDNNKGKTQNFKKYPEKGAVA